MTRAVKAYLIVTGLLAALALLVPELVIIGMFAFILPGLILALAPTAFLWGLAFALPWYALRAALGDYVAIVPAAVAGAAFVWLAPQSSMALSEWRLHRAIHQEVLPSRRVALAGHIRVDYVRLSQERSDPGAPYDAAAIESRAYVCDALCAALLATPGVRSVTVNVHEDAQKGGAP